MTIKVDHRPVSSLITYISYSFILKDDKKITERIHVQFKDGRLHEYYDYNDMEELYKNFITAPSVGKYWHKNIKDKYQCKKLR